MLVTTTDTQALVNQPIHYMGSTTTITATTTINDPAYISFRTAVPVNGNHHHLDTVDNILRAMHAAGAWSDDPTVWADISPWVLR